MSGKFWRVKVTPQDLEKGFYSGWRTICDPGVWTVDASGFSQTDKTGAWAVLAPTGRLVTGLSDVSNGAAPEFLGIVEAIKMIPPGGTGIVETDQLSISALVQDSERLGKLVDGTNPLWRELVDLLSVRDVTITWVRGHGRRSNARMAVVDEASRKAARAFENVTDVTLRTPESSVY
jgi:ribonuclease HI